MPATRSLLVSLLLLASCGPAQQPAPAPTAAATPGPLTSLEGTYRLIGLDGHRLDPDESLAVEIGADRIDFDNCQRIGWEYSFEDGQRLETERSPPPGEPCDEKLAIWKLQFVSAVDQLHNAERTPEGDIKLTGRLRSVTLASR